MIRGTIIIDQARCKGCNLCVSACPQGVIELDSGLNVRGYHPAVLNDPEGHCTGCAVCAVICPDAAITVARTPRKRIATT